MPELSQDAQHWVNVVLIWVGLGTMAGLLAKAVLPIREPAGSVATLLVGIAGSAIGLLVLSCFFSGRQLNPISPLGFLAATTGALFLLILYGVFYACFLKGKNDSGR